jgi:transcriptional regulator with XRE-family HTH domain
LAAALDITQSNYERLEKDDNRISVPRLIVIARTLETTVTELVGEKANTVVNQDHNHEAVTYLHANFQAIGSFLPPPREGTARVRWLMDRSFASAST